MPRSQNRRTIEVSAQLYDELQAEAEAEGLTIPLMLQAHITNSRAMAEYWTELSGQVAEMRRELRRLAESFPGSKA